MPAASRFLPLLLTLVSSAHAASLICAVTYPWTSTTRPASVGYGVPAEQKLESVRNAWKTEIYSVSIETGQRALLFSDSGPGFELLAPGIMALDAGKAYAKGVERYWGTSPNPGVYTHPEAIYELMLDGSNRFRKLFEIDAKNPASELFLSPDAAEIATIGYTPAGDVISIHEVSTGVLLHSWNATSLFQRHCPDCSGQTRGWLADGKRLFFTLEIGELDDDSPPPSDAVGTYFMTEDGKEVAGIPASAGVAHVPGYSRDPEDAPLLLGQSPGGDYVFYDFAFQRGAHSPAPARAQNFIVLADRDGRTTRVLPVRFSVPGSRMLSPSRRFLAGYERRQLKNYQSENHIWIEDLQSGTEKEVVATPPPGGSGLNIIGWDERN